MSSLFALIGSATAMTNYLWFSRNNQDKEDGKDKLM